MKTSPAGLAAITQREGERFRPSGITALVGP